MKKPIALVARRRLLLSALAPSLAFATPYEAAAQAAGPVDDWMQAWMGEAKGPEGGLYVFRFKDPMYALTRPIGWSPNGANPEKLLPVKVPTGFVSDLASVPRVFFSLLRPDGDYSYAAIIHDYLYWTQKIPKADVDLTFLRCMQDLGVDEKVALTIYGAVKLVGNAAWQNNAREKASGARRVLAEFPNNPSMTWGEWRLRPGVFVNGTE